MNFWVVAAGLLILAGFSIPESYVSYFRHSPGLLSFMLSDPSIHVYAFCVFTFVLGWSRQKEKSRNFSLGKIAFFSILYGIFIEVYQITLPWRSFELMDIFWDGAGVLAGLVAIVVLLKVYRRRIFGRSRI